MPSQNPLSDRFSSLQDELQAALKSAARQRHSVAMGDHSELNWLEMFQQHLPLRYAVDRAFVLDSTGAQSQQIDVVIYDRQYSFRIFNRSGQLYLPAESVYAVFEVKQAVTPGNLRYAGDKVASVRALERTRQAIPHAGGVVGAPQLKALPWILGGLLTTRAGAQNAFGPGFQAALRSLPAEHGLELGCVANTGAWSANDPPGGPANLEIQQGPLPLARFLLTLLRRLQAVGTVPAIDFRQYEKALDP